MGVGSLTTASSAATAVAGAMRPPFGTDAGVPYPPGATLRVTAAGTITLPAPLSGCSGPIGPKGCEPPTDAARPQPLAPYASLIGTFVDRDGRAVAPPFLVGEGALLVAPAVQTTLYLRANAYLEQAGGAFSATVVVLASPAAIGTLAGPPAATAAQVPIAVAAGIPVAASAAARAQLGTLHRGLGTRRGGPLRRSTDVRFIAPRDVARLYASRLGYGTGSAGLDAIVATGPAQWLDTQLATQGDDNALGALLNALPSTVDANGNIVDSDGYERRTIERAFGGADQVREKLVLHWLEHFSVGVGKVRDTAMMAHYESTLRADALGNFETLAADVAVEPAMLIWLDNDGNVGSNPGNPPNENFSRELMQLFILGTTRLAPDGTPLTDSSGPLPTFTQVDVTQAALALSGFKVLVDRTITDPNARFSVAFSAKAHSAATKTLLGKTVADPGDARCVRATLDVLVHDPTTAVFQARELIQRLVEPNPSPRYVAAIAAVWAQNVDAPDQIATVVRAIAADPEFLDSAATQVREPIEVLLDALRGAGGVLKSGTSGAVTVGGGADLAGAGGTLARLQQQPYGPASVFSFYRPGHKDQLLSQYTVLGRFNAFTKLLANNPAAAATTTAFDVSAAVTKLAPLGHAAAASALLDTTIGASANPALLATLDTYLQNGVDDAHVRGALWLIFTSPEFEVQ